jgi:PTS system ascorbate-specific IIA component
MNGVLIICHAPLAHALRQCALHVFPDCGATVAAVDVQPNLSPEETLATARIALHQLLHAPQVQTALVLTDLFGATPSNVAQKLVDGVHTRLVTGVNLPMILRAGHQGVMQVAITAPQNQSQRQTPRHDSDAYHHQQ